MRVRIKMDQDANGKPTWKDAMPGMIFDWSGSPRLVVANRMCDNPNQVYTVRLTENDVLWSWDRDKAPALTPTFIGYATDIEVTVRQEPVAA